MRSPRSLEQEFKSKNDQYVHNIEVVYRYPIYGFHQDKKPFLKIELYNPVHIKKCQNVLQQGVLLNGLQMQPYEAHLSYFMHFYGDYNLSGMDFFKITDFQIRHLDALDDQSSIAQLAYYP